MGKKENSGGSFKSSLTDKVLSVSNRYAFYKREYGKLIDENTKLKKDIQRLENNFNKIDNDLKDLKKSNIEQSKKDYDELIVLKRCLTHHMDKSFNHLKNVYRDESEFNLKFNRELQYAFVFNDTIKESEWLANKEFSLTNAAANYSLAYSLYRILNDAQPKNILELGLGQTTKITTQYANYFDDVNLSVIEGDQDWIDVFCEKLVTDENIDIIYRDLEVAKYNDEPTLRFKDVSEVLGDKKFDLIIIDGPQGHIPGESKNLEYSRTNILELIPNNLADDFLILMDDYNRVGERNTMGDVEKLLNDNDMEFFTYTCDALKSQHAVFSEKFRFISWI